MAHSSKRIEAHLMDERNSSDSASHDTKTRSRVLRSAHGHYYRIMPSSQAVGGCYRDRTFPTAQANQTFLTRQFMGDPYWRERLRLEATHWGAAQYGWGVMCLNPVESLAQSLGDGDLRLFEVVMSGPHRGAPKKPQEKNSAVLETVSTVADNTPWIAPVKSLLQAIVGFDLITDAPVSRTGELAGVALGIVPGGKVIAKVVGKISNKVTEMLGVKGGHKAVHRDGDPDAGLPERYHGPDKMTRTPETRKLKEWEFKGSQDGNTRVATNKKGHKQGSRDKNLAYAKKTLRQKKKVGKPSSRIGGPRTSQEMDVWQEVKQKKGDKTHMSVHTNTETGQVRVFERDNRGNIVKQTDEFQLDDFAATKKKLMEDFP